MSAKPKTNAGNFFEDFKLGQVIRHATPRTVTLGDVALYNGLFGARFAVQSSDAFAAGLGYPRSPAAARHRIERLRRASRHLAGVLVAHRAGLREAAERPAPSSPPRRHPHVAVLHDFLRCGAAGADAL